MKIGELSRRTGVSTRLLRYYEEQGLLHPHRRPNGYRTYAEGSVERVEQIRDLLKAGLSTQAIREFVPCFVGTGTEMRPMVHPTLAANLAHELAEIQQRIDVLVRNRDAIRAYVEAAGIADGAPPAGTARMPCSMPAQSAAESEAESGAAARAAAG